jgi:hypothetical protein
MVVAGRGVDLERHSLADIYADIRCEALDISIAGSRNLPTRISWERVLARDRICAALGSCRLSEGGSAKQNQAGRRQKQVREPAQTAYLKCLCGVIANRMKLRYVHGRKTTLQSFPLGIFSATYLLNWKSGDRRSKRRLRAGSDAMNSAPLRVFTKSSD